MGKLKNKGSIGYALARVKFSCGHTAYTNPDRKKCPKCEVSK